MPGSRERVEAAGIRAIQADLAGDDYSQIPSDFEYVLHLAAAQEPGHDYDGAIRANAEATGLLLVALPEGQGGAGDVDALGLQAGR